MPLNEAAAYRRTWLTKEQIHAETAAIYGNRDDSLMLTHDEAQQMRALLQKHDAESNRGGNREFDLNNPPKERYVFQEFPRCMYHPDGRTRKAHNRAEMEDALELGWLKAPAGAVSVDDQVLDAASATEAAEIDAKLRKTRKPKTAEVSE